MVDSQLYPFKSNFLTIDGNKIHYVDEGCESGKPTLVMVHGNPTWSFFWRDLISHFKKNYRVIAIDHMGCGMSDKPQNYTYVLSTHIENLTQLITSLNLKNITLFMHDWGGAIGMGYATKHAANIKGFVVFNTAAFASKNIPLRIAVCRIPGLGKLLIQGFNGFAGAATVMASKKGLSKKIKQGYLAPYNTFANRIATYEFVQDIPLNKKHPSWQTLADVESNLSKVKHLPMTLMWGGKDFCFNDSFLNTWKLKFPNAEVNYFKSAGHYVIEDASDQIIPLVTTFLNKVAHA